MREPLPCEFQSDSIRRLMMLGGEITLITALNQSGDLRPQFDQEMAQKLRDVADLIDPAIPALGENRS